MRTTKRSRKCARKKEKTMKFEGKDEMKTTTRTRKGLGKKENL